MMGFFDQVFAGGDGGGLLDFLRRNASAAIANTPGGLQSDTAQYGSPAAAAVASAVRQAPSVPAQPSAMPAPVVNAAPQQQPVAPASAPDPLASIMPPPGGQPHGFFGQLAAGLSSIAHGGTLAGLAMGQPDDPISISQRQQQQTIRTRYEALKQAGIPANQALLAAIDPQGAGKTIVDSVLGSDKYTFATLPDGTVVSQNARTGAAAPAFQGSVKPEWKVVRKDDGTEVYGFVDPITKKVTEYGGQTGAAGTITGPDGRPLQVPPGVDRQTFIKEVSKTNADAATGKMTETQAKAGGYAARMELAEANLKNLQNQGTGYWGRMMTGMPVIGGSAATNWATPGDYQKYQQSRDNFIAALLRQESGAAIGKSEYEAADRQYFPQPGDTPDVIRQKAETRKVAIEQMKRAAGPGYKSPTTGAAGGAADPLGIR